MCVRSTAYLSLFAYLHFCVCLGVHAYVCVCVRLCVCARARICVCAFICKCVCALICVFPLSCVCLCTIVLVLLLETRSDITKNGDPLRKWARNISCSITFVSTTDRLRHDPFPSVLISTHTLTQMSRKYFQLI